MPSEAVHCVPSQYALIESVLNGNGEHFSSTPTAKTLLGAIATTPRRWLELLPTLGPGTIVQAVPSQCIVKILSPGVAGSQVRVGVGVRVGVRVGVWVAVEVGVYVGSLEVGVAVGVAGGLW